MAIIAINPTTVNIVIACIVKHDCSMILDKVTLSNILLMIITINKNIFLYFYLSIFFNNLCKSLL